HALAMRDGRIARIVLVQRRAAAGLAQQVESGEMGQFETVVEDQRRLDAAVGQEQPAVKLRQMGSVLGHGPSSGFRAACRLRDAAGTSPAGLYPRLQAGMRPSSFRLAEATPPNELPHRTPAWR